MKIKPQHVLVIFLGLLILSCSNATNNKVKMDDGESISVADSVLNLALKAHGSWVLDTASFTFVFRKQTYSLGNENGVVKYTVTSTENDGRVFEDILVGSILTRNIDGKEFDLPAAKKAKVSSALNSVIYFATLPYKLLDNAVQLVYDGPQIVKDQAYLGLSVTFAEEGGGEDHDDAFYYWINAQTHRIDYMAYSYKVNNGGVRFRAAFNPRIVNGVLFQDYINYEARVGTALNTLPKLFALDSLKQLSLIETEQVKKLKN